MSVYGEGSVSIQVGSATVLGAGTQFIAYAGKNYVFRVRHEDTHYIINNVNSATNLTLSAVYSNVNASVGDNFTGIGYQIVIDYTPNRRFPEMASTDTNMSYIYTRAVRMLDNMLSDTASSNIFQFTKEVSASVTGVATECSNGDLTATNTEGVYVA